MASNCIFPADLFTIHHTTAEDVTYVGNVVHDSVFCFPTNLPNTRPIGVSVCLPR